MIIETYICAKQAYNIYMGGYECYSSNGILFYIDHKGHVKVDDEVKFERLSDGCYHRIWVNGILKT